jgi:hypothetical protein
MQLGYVNIKAGNKGGPFFRVFQPVGFKIESKINNLI